MFEAPASDLNNNDALLGKTHYSLYSSCCSTDLQGHSRWMIFMSFVSQYVTSY